MLYLMSDLELHLIEKHAFKPSRIEAFHRESLDDDHEIINRLHSLHRMLHTFRPRHSHSHELK